MRSRRERAWMRPPSTALLLLLFIAGVSTADELSVSQIASRIDRRYNHLTTLKAQFQENYNGAGLVRNESGQLWLQKPGRMRWQYEQPTPKLFIVDGKSAFFYVPSERQARRMPAKKLDDFRSPIRYLLGHTKLQQEFSKLRISAESPKQHDNVVLEGVPKGMEDRIQRALLEITPSNQIGRILIEQLDGSTTEFIFRDLQEDVVVKPDLFRFSPPPGVEVVDSQNLEP
ncbi:MAG: outer membrane lipoprotein carrier protein LolA [Acidobacteria bacterium]|nr:MAG: outer membrane lipoprotein carrier protein LolA [Acidobacteriota bacterium]PYY23050.1 MAG: outer membrane lipoprotein carrier protein LolA [Acidobacteriota bacterium]